MYAIYIKANLIGVELFHLFQLFRISPYIYVFVEKTQIYLVEWTTACEYVKKWNCIYTIVVASETRLAFTF